MRITQRFAKDEAAFIAMVDAIAAADFDVFSICQSIDGMWHAWIRLDADNESETARLNAAQLRGFAVFEKAEQTRRSEEAEPDAP